MAKMIFSKSGNKEEVVSAIKKLEADHNLHIKKLQDDHGKIISEYEKQLKEKSIEDMNKYTPSKLDFHQVLQHAFNEESGKLRVEGNLKFENNESGNQLGINEDGSLNIKFHEDDRRLLKSLIENSDKDTKNHIISLEKRLSYAKTMNVVLYVCMFILGYVLYTTKGM